MTELWNPTQSYDLERSVCVSDILRFAILTTKAFLLSQRNHLLKISKSIEPRFMFGAPARLQNYCLPSCSSRWKDNNWHLCLRYREICKIHSYLEYVSARSASLFRIILRTLSASVSQSLAFQKTYINNDMWFFPAQTPPYSVHAGFCCSRDLNIHATCFLLWPRRSTTSSPWSEWWNLYKYPTSYNRVQFSQVHILFLPTDQNTRYQCTMSSHSLWISPSCTLWCLLLWKMARGYSMSVSENTFKVAGALGMCCHDIVWIRHCSSADLIFNRLLCFLVCSKPGWKGFMRSALLKTSAGDIRCRPFCRSEYSQWQPHERHLFGLWKDFSGSWMCSNSWRTRFEATVSATSTPENAITTRAMFSSGVWPKLRIFYLFFF